MNRAFLQSHRSDSGGFPVTFSIAVYEFALNWKEIKINISSRYKRFSKYTVFLFQFPNGYSYWCKEAYMHLDKGTETTYYLIQTYFDLITSSGQFPPPCPPFSYRHHNSGMEVWRGNRRAHKKLRHWQPHTITDCPATFSVYMCHCCSCFFGCFFLNENNSAAGHSTDTVLAWWKVEQRLTNNIL